MGCSSSREMQILKNNRKIEKMKEKIENLKNGDDQELVVCGCVYGCCNHKIFWKPILIKSYEVKIKVIEDENLELQ